MLSTHNHNNTIENNMKKQNKKIVLHSVYSNGYNDVYTGQLNHVFNYKDVLKMASLKIGTFAKDKSFFNCVTSNMLINSTKQVSIKIYSNESIHITGIGLDIDDAYFVVNKLIIEICEHLLINK